MNDEFFSALIGALNQLETAVSDEATKKFGLYADMLIEKNKFLNLTAITNPQEVAVKHFADSLAVLSFIDIKPSAHVADVGTGAGFLGVPLLIARQDLNISLIDSTNKKLQFRKEACTHMGINPKIKHIRAEDAGKNPLYREKYDVVVSRAVADLKVLSEYCLPLVKPGGIFVSYKGEAEKELKEAKNAIAKLSGRAEATYEYELSDFGKKTLIIIRKISQTSPKYPRSSTQISKNPL
ncbi:MAG TPA: 16S rRNA (guanine(527)-N(7))-methyltransferase RsmG [Oscillospiraceae bacterium]|nr:16S rRNA (guanine(527)-N(7))-methyltransferase RsmG [Oscillospiraceae bacterium]